MVEIVFRLVVVFVVFKVKLFLFVCVFFLSVLSLFDICLYKCKSCGVNSLGIDTNTAKPKDTA